MKKRLLALVLWFYAGWAIGAMCVVFLGANSLVSPLTGLTAAILFAGDPFRLFWTARR